MDLRAQATSRESGVKGTPLRVPDAFAIDAGRFVRVQGCGRGRSPAPRGRWSASPRRDLLAGQAVELQRVEFEAIECFPG